MGTTAPLRSRFTLVFLDAAGRVVERRGFTGSGLEAKSELLRALHERMRLDPTIYGGYARRAR